MMMGIGHVQLAAVTLHWGKNQLCYQNFVDGATCWLACNVNGAPRVRRTSKKSTLQSFGTSEPICRFVTARLLSQHALDSELKVIFAFALVNAQIGGTGIPHQCETELICSLISQA